MDGSVGVLLESPDADAFGKLGGIFFAPRSSVRANPPSVVSNGTGQARPTNIVEVWSLTG